MDESMSSVLAKAAATLSKDIFLQPLRDLCVRKIALSLKFYVDSGVTSLHNHLLPKLCEGVFNSYVEQLVHERVDYFGREDECAPIYNSLSHPDILKIASLFVGAGLKRFDITVLHSPEEEGSLEDWKVFFKKLVEGAPNLASFDLDCRDYENYIFDDNSLPPSHFISFGQMPHLITLKIDSELAFTNADLQIIGSTLSLLRNLDIALDREVTIEEGLIHLKQLKKLEAFVLPIFEVEDVLPGKLGRENKRRLEFCLHEMPKLKITGCPVTQFFEEYDYDHSFSIFREKEEPVELGLEHLRLWDDFPPANVRLPNVTHLQVIGSCESGALNFCLSRSFPNLKVLTVRNVKFDELVNFLQSHGQLSQLSLMCVEGLCDLLLILNLCPHLECLTFDVSACVKDIAVINPSVSKSLTKMKKFNLQPYYTRNNSYCKAAGLLRMLLTLCPDLEELYLEVSMPQAEIDQVAAGFAAGAFLCTNKIVHLLIETKPIEATEEAMENFVMQVVAHCPKLESITVGNVRKSKLGPLEAIMNKFDRGHALSL